ARPYPPLTRRRQSRLLSFSASPPPSPLNPRFPSLLLPLSILSRRTAALSARSRGRSRRRPARDHGAARRSSSTRGPEPERRRSSRPTSSSLAPHCPAVDLAGSGPEGHNAEAGSAGPLLAAVLLRNLPHSSAPPLRGGDLPSGRSSAGGVRGGSHAGRLELPRPRRTSSPAAASPLCRVHSRPLPSPSSAPAVEMRQREGAEEEVDLRRRSRGGGAEDKRRRRSLWWRPPPPASTSAPCSEAGQERWGQRECGGRRPTPSFPSPAVST
ncbi:unnamed protein product, partial [Urochloa humidicola]